MSQWLGDGHDGNLLRGISGQTLKIIQKNFPSLAKNNRSQRALEPVQAIAQKGAEVLDSAHLLTDKWSGRAGGNYFAIYHRLKGIFNE